MFIDFVDITYFFIQITKHEINIRRSINKKFELDKLEYILKRVFANDGKNPENDHLNLTRPKILKN